MSVKASKIKERLKCAEEIFRFAISDYQGTRHSCFGTMDEKCRRVLAVRKPHDKTCLVCKMIHDYVERYGI
jgi:hypothetical protein